MCNGEQMVTHAFHFPWSEWPVPWLAGASLSPLAVSHLVPRSSHGKQARFYEVNGEELATARRLRLNVRLKCSLRNSDRVSERKRTEGKYFIGERSTNDDGRKNNKCVCTR